jgi:hypothetical protein
LAGSIADRFRASAEGLFGRLMGEYRAFSLALVTNLMRRVEHEYRANDNHRANESE